MAVLMVEVDPFQAMGTVRSLRELADELLAKKEEEREAERALSAGAGESVGGKEIAMLKRKLDRMEERVSENEAVEQDLLGGLGTFEDEAQYRRYHDLKDQWKIARQTRANLVEKGGEEAAALMDPQINKLQQQLDMLKAATKFGGELQDLLKFGENTSLVDPATMDKFEELAKRRNKLTKWSKSRGHNGILGGQYGSTSGSVGAGAGNLQPGLHVGSYAGQGSPSPYVPPFSAGQGYGSPAGVGRNAGAGRQVDNSPAWMGNAAATPQPGMGRGGVMSGPRGVTPRGWDQKWANEKIDIRTWNRKDAFNAAGVHVDHGGVAIRLRGQNYMDPLVSMSLGGTINNTSVCFACWRVGHYSFECPFGRALFAEGFVNKEGHTVKVPP
jgi:hypothetical protein